MDLENAIFGRRSIRFYDKTKMVEEAIIKEIIYAGTWAPSACNVQGWKFIVIDDKNVFDKIIKYGAATFLNSVNQAILVVYDNRTDNMEYMDYIQSAGACIENMLLKAYSLGVGTCWVNNLPEKKKLKKILNIPWNYEPIALISIGYNNQKINERQRKYKIDDLIAFNKFDFSVEKKDNKYYKLKIKRILRKIYYKLPCKNLLLKFVGKYEKKFDN